LKILIVEDDAATREAIARFVASNGHEVGTASDPDSANSRAEDLEPDVVICDWQLSDEIAPDGVDVASEMYERYRSSVILITGHSLSELKNRAKNLNVAQFIRKPFSLVCIDAALAALQ